MASLMALGIVLLFLGVYGAWDGVTHVGPGVWTFGGDDVDDHSEVVSEAQYKRECYRAAVMFFVFGGLILCGATENWKERNRLEKSWERTISNPENVQDIHKHPENYRDDFKKWIKENHPELAPRDFLQQPNRP